MNVHSSESTVLASQDGPVSILTINRPDKANAINGEVSTLIAQGLAAAEADDSVRVVIITGAEDRFFSAGADVAAMQRGEDVLPSSPYESFGLGGCTTRTISKPVIAAVNGRALGGGFEIALAADLVVADPGATFAFPESRVGIFPGAGGVHRLRARLPVSVATSVLLTGEQLSVERAAHFGLVTTIAEPGGSVAAALQVAAQIVKSAPLGIRFTKQLLRDLNDYGHSRHEADAWARSNELRDRILQSHDAREGFAAFAEKREPRWSGT